MNQANYLSRLRALLIQAVREAERTHEASVRAADIHNNSEWVGIKFDYISPTPLPQWAREARDLLSQKVEVEPEQPSI